MALSENSKRVAALMEEGKDPAAIAKALHMSMEDVHEHRSLVFAEMDKQERERKIRTRSAKEPKTGRRSRKTSATELATLAQLLAQGRPIAEIAKIMKRSTPWVYNQRAKLAAQPAPVAESRQEEPADGVHFTEDGTPYIIATPVEEAEQEQPKPDMVNHPPHYKQGRFECFDVIVALLGVEGAKAFCKGNIIKYRYRAAAKNGAEDIAKADRYMEMLKELEGGEHNAAD